MDYCQFWLQQHIIDQKNTGSICLIDTSPTLVRTTIVNSWLISSSQAQLVHTWGQPEPAVPTTTLHGWMDGWMVSKVVKKKGFFLLGSSSQGNRGRLPQLNFFHLKEKKIMQFSYFKNILFYFLKKEKKIHGSLQHICEMNF